MTLRVALIIFAPKEYTLIAGQREINPAPEEESDGNEPEEEILPFLKVGRVDGDDFHVSGPFVEKPEHIGASMAIGWYLPDEEEASEARVINLAEAQVAVTTAPRKKADPDWRWQYRLESRLKSFQTNFYKTGFQPPFNPADLTLHLWHTINYNVAGYIMAKVDYSHRPPSYIESEWRAPKLEAEGFLDD